MSQIGILKLKQGKVKEAEQLLLDSLAIRKKLGTEDSHFCEIIYNLAQIEKTNQNFEQAAKQLFKALNSFVKVNGVDDNFCAKIILEIEYLNNSEPKPKAVINFCEKLCKHHYKQSFEPKTAVCLYRVGMLEK